MVRCLLWDFGDTLVDELSLWRTSPDWMEVYRSFGEEGGLGAAWCLGEIDLSEMVTELAQRTSLAEADVQSHLHNVDLFHFFPCALEFFRARHLPQAIVTVNPVYFRRLATLLGLDKFVDEIVISGEERTVDKAGLCELALERMGGQYAREEALLIDNSRPNIEGWLARSGAAYWYTTDEAFSTDSANGPDGLARAGRISA
jgi:FMN phosphatase YigB (HAD superfamily)